MTVYCTIPADTLRVMLEGAMVAADKTLPTLTGVRIEWANGDVTAVSTDRYRLYRGVYNVASRGESGMGDEGAILLPADEVKALMSLLPKVNTRIPSNLMVHIQGNGNIAAEDGSWSRTCQLLLGEFPKWRALVERDTASVETIGFNPKFVADAAKIPHNKGERMVMRFTGTSSAAFLSYEGKPVAHVDATYMLMPMRSVG